MPDHRRRSFKIILPATGGVAYGDAIQEKTVAPMPDTVLSRRLCEAATAELRIKRQ
jgi:hypothetical protein